MLIYIYIYRVTKSFTKKGKFRDLSRWTRVVSCEKKPRRTSLEILYTGHAQVFFAEARAQSEDLNEEEEDSSELEASGGCVPLRDALSDEVAESELVDALTNSARRLGGVASRAWLVKCTQLRSVLALSLGCVLVGGAGCGKSVLWRALLLALEAIDGVRGECYVMDPKAFCCLNYKELLFGRLDATTLEWTDGVLTSVLRCVVANERGESSKRHWIVLDGDVDPEWAENLNSVLDDNRVLTLPNGERIAVPSSVRFLFEVESLDRATPATVSRCGVLHVGADVVALAQRLEAAHAQLCTSCGADFAQALQPLFAHDGAVGLSVAFALSSETRDDDRDRDRDTGDRDDLADDQETQQQPDYVMAPVCCAQPLATLECLLSAAAREARSASLKGELLFAFARRACLCCCFWACGGAASEDERRRLSQLLSRAAEQTGDAPSTRLQGTGLLCYDVRATVSSTGGGGVETAVSRDAFWEHWDKSVRKVPPLEDSAKALDAVIATCDTARHEQLVDALCGGGGDASSQHQSDLVAPLLCGPPGSGKTMTCTHALGKRADAYALAPLACSSGTTASEIAQLLAEHCELGRCSSGDLGGGEERGRLLSQNGATRSQRETLALLPKRNLYGETRSLVLFCDELNLVSSDAYGTARALALVRQLVERRGFWAFSTVSAQCALEPQKFARTGSQRCAPRWARTLGARS